MLRLPSLIAGTATIPLTYLLGARTVGKRAGRLQRPSSPSAPSSSIYSTEARGYAVMIALMVASTLCLLRAVEGGRGAVVDRLRRLLLRGDVHALHRRLRPRRPGAVGALVHIPPARRAVLLANLGAALAYLPWALGGDRGHELPDDGYRLEAAPLHYRRDWLSRAHWSVGYPWGLSLPSCPATLP